MNDELDRLLESAMNAGGRWDDERARSVKREVAAVYESKLKMWACIIWGLLVVDAALMVGAVFVFAWSGNVKVLIGSAAVGLWAFESSILMKLWYWQMNTKYAVLKEMAELRLQLAQMTESQKRDQ